MSSMSLLVAFVALSATASAQSCISLAGSTQCPAFNGSSVSTNEALKGLYPFLQSVSSTEDFDIQLAQYVNSSYVQSKYQQLLGCTKVDMTNTTNYYARYTTTVICNAIVQNSVDPCGLSGSARTPLCAETCADFATSEESIAVNSQLCGVSTDNNNYLSQIRADFTNCALPADSLTGQCVSAVQNEPDNCGYGPNLGSLCSYCASSSPNATDSCCVASKVTDRCQGVAFPSSVSALPALFTTTTTATATATATAAAANSKAGLSGGAIAGIVIGSIIGLLLLGLIILACIVLRRRRSSQKGSIFNQPSPPRTGVSRPVVTTFGGPDPFRTQGTPGRVTRLAALESGPDGSWLDEKADTSGSEYYGRHDTQMSEFAAAAGAAAAAGQGHRPVAGQRAGSLGSFDMLSDDYRAATPAAAGLPSPENGHAPSGQSEQLPYFKDYYSSDDIHPGDSVAVLWGYQPRAADEFELDRGDMLKVVGIWDDGWATGVRVLDRAEDWRAGKDKARDSGVSHGAPPRTPSPTGDREVKAFPLVCVCLPQHWRKTVEGSDATSPSES